jgi:lysophospholipase L1-like esterase
MKKQLRNAALIAAAGLIFVEAVLQLSSFCYLRTIPRVRPVSSERDLTVLCIGDSFTFGIGAPASQSYPQQMQELLRSRFPGARIDVVNQGTPGSNSSIALRTLQQRISTQPPLVAVVWVGMNNIWNFSEVYSAFSLGCRERVERFLLHFKTYKLLRMCIEHSRRQKVGMITRINMPPAPEAVRFPKWYDSTQVRLRDTFQSAEYNRARAYAERILRFNPNDHAAQLVKARCLRMRLCPRLSQQSYQRALETAPSMREYVVAFNELRLVTTPAEYQEYKRRLRQEIGSRFGQESARAVPLLLQPQVTFGLGLRVLEEDLERMYSVAAMHHVPLVVITYPDDYHGGKINEVLASFCARRKVTLIDNNIAHFTAADARGPLFVADGHCSGAGYKIVAERVADALAGYIQKAVER